MRGICGPPAPRLKYLKGKGKLAVGGQEGATLTKTFICGTFNSSLMRRWKMFGKQMRD